MDEQLKQAIREDYTVFDAYEGELSARLVGLIKSRMEELGDELQYLRVEPRSKLWSTLVCYKHDLELSDLYQNQEDCDPDLKYDINYMFKVTNTNDLGLAVGKKNCFLFAFTTKANR